MVKRLLIRSVLSFSCAVTINVILYAVLITLEVYGGAMPMLPEFQARFEAPAQALLIQCILVGLSSAAFGGGSVILEIERMGLIAQSVLYFIVTTAVWLPVACLCWGIHKYPVSLLGVGVSYVIAYIISWVIQYRSCRRSVEQINVRLRELSKEG